jgi:adenylylsulfate kinase-like enzyme
MTLPPVPVLWVSGAPGVGKSTAGWGLYRRMRSTGRPVAYVDVDQLGLFSLDPPDDPDRRRLQAANAIEVLTNFAGHGATHLIVSGVVDPQHGIDPYLRHAQHLDVTLVRLRADWTELRRRYLGRRAGIERLDELAALADTLDRTEAGVVVDVTRMTPEQVVDALVDMIGTSDGRTPAHPAPPKVSGASAGAKVPVLLITGPTAVGKSTIGWNVLTTLCGRGLTAAYIDVDQLGFISTGPSRQLKAENARSAWHGYHAVGARCLIVVARGAPGSYEHAFTGELVTSVHLDAAPADLAERIAQRGRGIGPRLAGDTLIGATPSAQSEIADRATTEARTFRQPATSGRTVIDTSGQDSATVTGQLLELLEPTLPVG